MGCDIHAYTERKNDDGQYEVVGDFLSDGRSYAVFGFLAGVRNYSEITPISEPRGIPADASPSIKSHHERWSDDAHSASWLSTDELINFDYLAMCEDRRCSVEVAPRMFNGGCTCNAGDGLFQTYKDFLGEWYFSEVQKAIDEGATRIVFWFDN